MRSCGFCGHQRDLVLSRLQLQNNRWCLYLDFTRRLSMLRCGIGLLLTHLDLPRVQVAVLLESPRHFCLKTAGLLLPWPPDAMQSTYKVRNALMLLVHVRLCLGHRSRLGRWPHPQP